MKGLGIIAEYNPLHNGHLYHIKKSKEAVNPDFVMIIMSGNWVQRGEPAILDKWQRTSLTLEHGADLVIELPFIWATQSAAEFAHGSVSLLHASNVIHYQSFGSESGDLSTLKKAAKVSLNEPPEFKKTLQQTLKQGKTYSEALSNALQLSDLASNDILGIEYLKSHLKLNSPVNCLTIQRIESSYHDTHLSGSYSSATSIRANVQAQAWKEVFPALPKDSYDVLYQASESCVLPHFTDLEKFILYKLRISSTRQLKRFIEWEPGLEHRSVKAAMQSSSFDEFISRLKTKRYTRTRLNRFLLHCLLELTGKELKKFNKINPPYLRVLGMNTKGRKVLRHMKEHAHLPILTRPARELRRLSPSCRACFNWEAKASALYDLLISHRGDKEFTETPILINGMPKNG